MISDAIVTAVTTVILIALVVNFIDFTVPFYTKLQFNQTCKEYAIVVASEGSLTSEQYEIFEASLERLGCQNIDIVIEDATGKRFGAPIEYRVESEVTAFNQVALFKREEVVLPCNYETTLIYRKYIN